KDTIKEISAEYELLSYGVDSMGKNISLTTDEYSKYNEIVNQIEKIATTVNTDNIGNVIAFKKGKKSPKNKVMLSCHMDEVGMIVTGVCDDGTLKFSTIGGINPKVIIGRSVKVAGLVGVIGTKAIHNQTPEERKTAASISGLSIDIGATDKKNALEHINLGDSVNFVSDYKEFGDGFIKAKAIDDRAG
ncbi:MAG: M42 family peptidase, partial [Oscillospiraceae bacterium]